MRISTMLYSGNSVKIALSFPTFPFKTAGRILLVLILLSGLYVISWYSYLLFHTVIEIISVIIAGSIFILAWNTKGWIENDYLLFLGISFLCTGSIDLLHALTYKGINILAGYDANLPTQLWVLARTIQSISLLIAPLWFQRRLSPRLTLVFYFLVSAALTALVFARLFPASYIEGVGLTPFKIYSEYVIIAIVSISILALWRNRRKFEPGVLRSWLVFVMLTIAAELAFTSYLSVYGSANLLGHLLRLLAYLFAYEAFLRTGLQRPFNLVFRNLKQQEAALLRSQTDLQSLFDISPFPILVTAPSDSHFLMVNRAALDLFEMSPADLENAKGLDFYVHPDERWDLLAKLRKEGSVKNKLMELKTMSDERIWCLVNVIPTNLNGEPALLLGMADITEQRRIQEELRYLSTHDALTGIYNRTYFEAEMERLQKGRSFPVSIIIMDVDELKRINDSYGHAQGDQVLHSLAGLVKEILRGEEVFARIGGDEFAILLPRAELDGARQVISRIQDQLGQHTSENGNIPIRVSIGLGVANEKEELSDALKRADAHMYADKNIKKGNYRPGHE